MPGAKWLSHERIAFLGCLIVALLALWQGAELDMWTIVGPGPGLFPSIAALVAAGLALALALFPALGDDHRTSPTETEPEPEHETPMDARERRILIAYCLALPFLVVGSMYLGFTLLAIVLALFLTWWAEGRNWRGALAFGVGAGLIGVIGFNHYLETSIPLGPLDQMLLQLVR